MRNSVTTLAIASVIASVLTGGVAVASPSSDTYSRTVRVSDLNLSSERGADTALRIGLVSEVVSRDRLWARANEIAAAIAAKPPSATQGTVKAIWESLDKPYRAALEQNLIYTRLGNPLGQAELATRGNGVTAKPRVR